jgi:hypothetical protein
VRSELVCQPVQVIGPVDAIHAPGAVELGALVKQVRVAPGEPLLFDVVTSVTSQYGLDIEVSQSSLDSAPRY